VSSASYPRRQNSYFKFRRKLLEDTEDINTRMRRISVWKILPVRITPNGKANDELERIRKEAVVA
jgi:hypothetical protein